MVQTIAAALRAGVRGPVRAPGTAPAHELQPFSLTRWFLALSLACIVLVSAVQALLVSKFLTDRILHRDAELTMEFVQSVVFAGRASSYFLDAKTRAEHLEMEAAFRLLALMPDVLHANVYTRERSIVWSSNRELIGRRFEANPDLDRALAGQLEFQLGVPNKEEHVGVRRPLASRKLVNFVEIYVPVWDDARRTVIGAVELYRASSPLVEVIAAARRLIWLSDALGALILFLALAWAVRRADNVIREQAAREKRQQLMEMETLAAFGEMASAVAHGIRGPMAVIRSSAELALDQKSGDWREPAMDIINEIDRVELWVRELLRYSRPGVGGPEPVEVNPVIRKSLANFEREAGRRGIVVAASCGESVPAVRGDPALLGQVLNGLIANALHAMSQEGRLEVRSRAAADRRYVEISISDSGTGIAAEEQDRVFMPFYTTKAKGLGLGLPLARRIVERHGGTLTLASTPGAGTTVTLRLLAA